MHRMCAIVNVLPDVHTQYILYLKVAVWRSSSETIRTVCCISQCVTLKRSMNKNKIMCLCSTTGFLPM